MTVSPDVESSHGWLLSVWFLVAAFVAVTLVESARVGIPTRDPGGAWFASRVAISSGVFVKRTCASVWKTRTVTGRVVFETWPPWPVPAVVPA